MADLWHHYQEGGWAMWLILFWLICSIAVIAERAVYLWGASINKDVFLARARSGAGHAYALLCTQTEKELYERMRSADYGPVPFALLVRHMAVLADAHRGHWRKDATTPGSERGLTVQAVRRLTALGLVSDGPDGIRPLPALARFGYGQPVLAGPSGGSE